MLQAALLSCRHWAQSSMVIFISAAEEIRHQAPTETSATVMPEWCFPKHLSGVIWFLSINTFNALLKSASLVLQETGLVAPWKSSSSAQKINLIISFLQLLHGFNYCLLRRESLSLSILLTRSGNNVLRDGTSGRVICQLQNTYWSELATELLKSSRKIHYPVPTSLHKLCRDYLTRYFWQSKISRELFVRAEILFHCTVIHIPWSRRKLTFLFASSPEHRC